MGPTILVRAPNWLGDTVMALPALRSLRAALREARIILLGPWAECLIGQEVADALLAFPRDRARSGAFTRALASQRADLAVLFPNSFESALTAWRWRARRRLGFVSDARGILLTDRVPLPSPRLHQVDEYRLLVAALGIEVSGPEPEWRARADVATDAEAERLLLSEGIEPGRRPVGLHLGAATSRAKQWAPERFGTLAERLARRGFTPVLMGAPTDRDAERRARAAAAAPLASLIGKDRVALLPPILRRLVCLVSGDTGVAHLAAALGVPTVTLFGPTDARLTRPRGPRARLVRGAAPCAPCFLDECPIDHVCMRGIDIARVEEDVRAAAA